MGRNTVCAIQNTLVTRPVAHIPIAHSDNIAIRFRWQQDSDYNPNSLYPCLHGDDTNAAYWKILNADIFYYDGAWRDTGHNTSADTWHLFEMRNFVWATPSWDLVFDGAVIAAGIGVNPTGLYEDIGETSGGSALDGDQWLDNFLIRNFTTTEPTWGAWGSEEKIPRHGFVNFQNPGIV